MKFLEKVQLIYRYGPYREDQLKQLKLREDKKKAARLKRVQRIKAEHKKLSKVDKLVFGVTGEDVVRNQDSRARRIEAAAAEKELGFVDVYLRGLTGEDVLRNRERAQREFDRKVRNVFREQYADEIELQARTVLRLSGKKWWQVDDDYISAARRKAERELWNEHKNDDDFLESMDTSDRFRDKIFDTLDDLLL